jgi:hypothetical protein
MAVVAVQLSVVNESYNGPQLEQLQANWSVPPPEGDPPSTQSCIKPEIWYIPLQSESVYEKDANPVPLGLNAKVSFSKGTFNPFIWTSCSTSNSLTPETLLP